MNINIENIPNEGLSIDFNGTEAVLASALTEIKVPHDFEFDPNVTGYIHLSRQKDGILLVGNINGKLNAHCARCLKVFTIDKELNLSLLMTESSGEKPGNGEVDKYAEDAYFIEGDSFDPGRIFLLEMLLELPMKPLCSEDCPGLCPKCGAVKGSSSCTCETEEKQDPRWDALARLREKMEKNE
jgi:uncharacterized protein